MPAAVKERKSSQSASSKIDNIIKQLFLPMLNMSPPSRTSFLPEDTEGRFMRHLGNEHPDIMEKESLFVDHMLTLYRKYLLGVLEQPPLQAQQLAAGALEGALDGDQIVAPIGGT